MTKNKNKIHDPNKPKETLSSVWGRTHDQSKWLQWKNSLINIIAQLLTEPDLNFDTILSRIARERCIIDRILRRASPYDLSAFSEYRPYARNSELTSPILEMDRYETVAPLLRALYEATPKDNDFAEGRILHLDIEKFDRVYPNSRVSIQFNSIPYTTITDCIILTRNAFKGMPCLMIAHALAVNIDRILDVVESLFNQLDRQTNELNKVEKIDLIKQIAWHLSHASPFTRGSASICEILIEALLKRHDIPHELDKNAVSIDLVALFTTTPEQFSRLYIINSEIENILPAPQESVSAAALAAAPAAADVEPTGIRIRK